MIKELDAMYALHGFSSRSEMVCIAVDFYLGYLKTQSSTQYIDKTILNFLENQLSGLEAKVCRQLFRMCVEIAMASHISASQIGSVDEDTLKRLRRKCVKDVKYTIGNIRYDDIYQYQHEDASREEDGDETKD